MTRLLSLYGNRRRFALVGFLFVCALAFVSPVFAADFVGQTVKARGDVRVTREGADMACGNGTALKLGDVIKTGPGARLRIRFLDGSILTLGEKTSMSIDLFSVDAANKSRAVVLTVLEGIVNAAAAKSGESKFDYQIRSANGYSAVRGTKWIFAMQNLVMGVFVLNGQVEMGATVETAKPVLIGAGNWSSVDAQGTMTPVQPTPPDVLKLLQDATSDTASLAPAPVPAITPTQPVPQYQPVKPPRALKNDHEKQKPDKEHTH